MDRHDTFELAAFADKTSGYGEGFSRRGSQERYVRGELYEKQFKSILRVLKERPRRRLPGL